MPLSEEGVHHVMVRKVADYPKDRIFKRVFSSMTGNGLLLSEGEDWRAQRKAIGPAFTPNAAKGIARQVVRFVDEASPRLIPPGERVDLHALIDELTFDLAVHILSPDAQGDPPAGRNDLRVKVRETLHADIWDAVLPSWMPVPRTPGRRRAARQLNTFVDALVARGASAANDTPPQDLLSQFIAAYGPTGLEAPGGLRDQLKTFIITASHTLTDTLYCAFALLAQNKAAQDWLHRSIAGKDLSPSIIEQSLPQLVEVRAFFREVLRLYPAIPLIWAAATSDDVIAGHKIKAGTLVLVAPWALHRHHRYWADPNAFDMRRFLPGAAEPSRSIYIPFGTGPRVCIGQYLALTKAIVVISKLILAR